MIYNNRFLFLHVPKTGGMALSDALLKSLEGPVSYAVPQGHAKKVKYGENIITGKRHETLKGAQNFFIQAGEPHRVEQFECILAMVRDPYDIEISRFHYLQKGHDWDKGRAQDLAMAGDFDKFVVNSTWWFNIEDFFVLDGKIPPNLSIVRFENFVQQIPMRFGQFFSSPFSLGTQNKSPRDKEKEYINSQNEVFIYKKYSWLFDKGFYDRLVFV